MGGSVLPGAIGAVFAGINSGLDQAQQSQLTKAKLFSDMHTALSQDFNQIDQAYRNGSMDSDTANSAWGQRVSQYNQQAQQLGLPAYQMPTYTVLAPDTTQAPVLPGSNQGTEYQQGKLYGPVDPTSKLPGANYQDTAPTYPMKTVQEPISMFSGPGIDRTSQYTADRMADYRNKWLGIQQEKADNQGAYWQGKTQQGQEGLDLKAETLKMQQGRTNAYTQYLAARTGLTEKQLMQQPNVAAQVNDIAQASYRIFRDEPPTAAELSDPTMRNQAVMRQALIEQQRQAWISQQLDKLGISLSGGTGTSPARALPGAPAPAAPTVPVPQATPPAPVPPNPTPLPGATPPPPIPQPVIPPGSQASPAPARRLPGGSKSKMTDDQAKAQARAFLGM